MKSNLSFNQQKPWFSNRDLLIAAVISGIGGVMSSYISYLGNLLNKVLGVPFGAGQFVAGLHTFWIILAVGLIRKPGTGTLAGLLKGFIEFLAGSPHGITIIIVSLVQGLIVDLVFLVIKRYSLSGFVLAGALATASNVIVFQFLFFANAPLAYIMIIAGVAAISGMLLAGSFAYNILTIIIQARPFRSGVTDILVYPARRKITVWITGILFLVFTGGLFYYYAAIYEAPWAGSEVLVVGLVEKETKSRLTDFNIDEVTIRAELKGQFTNIPEQDYAGIPVKDILHQAELLPEATRLIVEATDGYRVEFTLAKIMHDERFILIKEDNTVRLIAGNYDGACWVRMVNKLIIE